MLGLFLGKWYKLPDRNLPLFWGKSWLLARLRG